MGVPGSSPSCGSFRPEPEASQLEGARSIAVDPVAADASVPDKAGKRIAARSLSGAEGPLANGAFIASADKLACCGRH
jgi:hypothetical protein